MPAGGKNVGKEGEGGFVLSAGGEREGVEVGKRDAEVLGLWIGGCLVRFSERRWGGGSWERT